MLEGQRNEGKGHRIVGPPCACIDMQSFIPGCPLKFYGKPYYLYLRLLVEWLARCRPL